MDTKKTAASAAVFDCAFSLNVSTRYGQALTMEVGRQGQRVHWVQRVQRGWKGRTIHIASQYPIYNFAALLILMRRTTPSEPIEPIKPIEPV